MNALQAADKAGGGVERGLGDPQLAGGVHPAAAGGALHGAALAGAQRARRGALQACRAATTGKGSLALRNAGRKIWLDHGSCSPCCLDEGSHGVHSKHGADSLTQRFLALQEALQAAKGTVLLPALRVCAMLHLAAWNRRAGAK